MNQEPVALITGGAKRIGAVIVKALHQSGYRVVIHYHRSENEAQELANSLNEIRSNSAVTFSADLNQFDSFTNIVHQAFTVWRRLDVLVNNASSFFPTAVGSTTEAEWDDLINTNLKAPYFLAQAAAPHLKLHQGCIINIADIHGKRPLKGYSVYSIAKAGLIMLTQTLARELAPAIRVNAIAPGITLLPEKTYPENFIEEMRQRTLLKHFPNPAEIAQAVLFLIQQPSITAQTICIDAGRSI